MEQLEDAKAEAFDEWFDGYTRSLGEDGFLSFLMKYYEEAMDGYEPFNLEYEIAIPEEIIAMASIISSKCIS